MLPDDDDYTRSVMPWHEPVICILVVLSIMFAALAGLIYISGVYQ
jgi:hypothetical protein